MCACCWSWQDGDLGSQGEPAALELEVVWQVGFCDGHSSLGVICGSGYPLLQDQQLLQLGWDVLWCCQRLRFHHQHKKVNPQVQHAKGSIN